MKAKDVAIIGGLGIATIYVLSMLVGREVKEAANAVNPLNNDNIFARGVDAIGDILDDGQNDGSFSLGGFIFDVFNGTPEDRAITADIDGRIASIERQAANNINEFLSGRQGIDG